MGLLFAVSLLVCGPARAVDLPGFVTRNLMGVPTPEVLPAKALSFNARGRAFFDMPEGTNDPFFLGPDWTWNVGLGWGFEIGLATSSDDRQGSYAAGQVKWRVVKGGDFVPGIAVGMMDITGNSHPITYSTFPVTGSPYYSHDENYSLFSVLSYDWNFEGVELKPCLGIGSGRFQGQGPTNEKLHGAFGGGEMKFMDLIWTAGEFDGRNANAGAGVTFLVEEGLKQILVNAGLWGMYLQNLRPASQDIGLRPALGVRIELAFVPGPRKAAGDSVNKKEKKPRIRRVRSTR